jgi:hypothetical protein
MVKHATLYGLQEWFFIKHFVPVSDKHCSNYNLPLVDGGGTGVT